MLVVKVLVVKVLVVKVLVVKVPYHRLKAAIKAGIMTESAVKIAVSGTNNNVLAVIENFTGTFDVNDLFDTSIIVADIV